MADLDDYVVLNGRIVKEIPTTRLDAIIDRNTERIDRINTRLAELRAKKDECHARIDRARVLKAELPND